MSGGSSTGPGSMQGGTGDAAASTQAARAPAPGTESGAQPNAGTTQAPRAPPAAMDAAQRARLNRMFDVARANHRVNFRELGQRAAERQRQAIEQRKRLLQAEEERKERARRRLERKRREAERGAATAESSSDSDDAALGDEEAGGGGSYVDDGEGTCVQRRQGPSPCGGQRPTDEASLPALPPSYSDEERDLTLMNRGMISRDEYGWRRRKAMSRKRRALARETAEKRDAAARRARVRTPRSVDSALRSGTDLEASRRSARRSCVGGARSMCTRGRAASTGAAWTWARERSGTRCCASLPRRCSRRTRSRSASCCATSSSIWTSRLGCVYRLLGCGRLRRHRCLLQDKMGRTALMVAAKCGDVALIKFLVESGVNPDVEDKMGRTALMIAAKRGNASAVKALILDEFGNTRGKVLHRNKHRRTAIDVAVDANRPAIVGILRSAVIQQRNNERGAAGFYRGVGRAAVKAVVTAPIRARKAARRARLAPSLNRDRREEAARIFQAAWRGHCARQQYRDMRRIVRLAQTRELIRRFSAFYRDHVLVVRVQRTFRAYLARKRAREYRRMCHAAILVQTRFRVHRAVQLVYSLRAETCKAVLMQRLWRGHKGRQRAQHARTLRDSATTIQRMWRGVMGRRRRWTWLQELSHAATVELLRRHTADLRWMLVVEGLKQQKVAVWQIENTWRAFCRVTQLKNVMRRRLFSAWRNEYTWDEVRRPRSTHSLTLLLLLLAAMLQTHPSMRAPVVPVSQAARTVQRVYRGFLGRRTAAVRRSVIKDWHREIQGCLVVRRLHAFGGRVSNATKVAKQNVTYLDTERERGREGDPALPGDGTEPMAPWKRRERKPTVPRQHRKPPTATKRLMGILGLENGPGQPGGPQERREGSVPALTASPGQWSRQRTDPMALALTVVPPHSSDEDEDDEGEGAWNAGGASQHSRGAHRSPARKQGRGRGDGQRLALLAPSPLAAHKRPSPGTCRALHPWWDAALTQHAPLSTLPLTETPPSSAGQQPGSAPERRRRRAPATDAFPPSRTPARTPLSTERRRWRSQQQEGTGGGALRSGRLGLRASQSGPNLGMDGPPALPPAVEAARGRKRLEARRLRAELRASEQREEALRARRAREEVEKRRREREASNRAAKHAAMAPLALPSGRGPTPPGSHPARSTRSALDGASESFASYASRGMADARDARVWAAMERATHSPSKRAPFTPGAAPWASKRDAYGTDEEEGYGYGDWAAENEWGRARPSDAATREPRTGWRGDEEEDQWEDSEEEDEEEGSADDRHMPPAPQPEAGEGASPGSPRDGAGGGDVERVGPRMTGSFDRSVVVILRHDQTALDGHGQAHRMWQLRRQKRGGGRATQETARSEAPAEGVEEEQAGSWLGLTYPTLRAQYPALVLVKRASLPADVYAAAPRVVWLTGLDEGHGVLLGRGRSADVQLDSAVYPKLVSSRHAMLRASRTTRLLHAPPGLQPREDDASERHPPSGTGHKHVEWVVGAEDLDSTNGTFLNGARVCREDGSVRLHHGDVITLGANATDTRSRSDVVFVVSLPQGVAQEAQRERQRRKRDADPAPRPVRARRLGTSHRDARSNAAALVPVGAGGDGSSDEKAREKEEDQQSKEQQQQQQPPQQQQSPPAPPAESSALLHVLQQQQQLLGAVVTMGMSRQWGGGMYGAAPQPWGQPQYDGYGYGPDQGYAYGHSASQGYGYDYGQGYGHDASPPAPGSEARPDTHRQRQAGQAPEGGAAGDHAVGAEDSASAGGQEGGEPAPTPQPSSAGEGEGSSPLPARRGCSTHGGSPRGSESPPTQTLALPAPEESEEERAARERREREQEKDRGMCIMHTPPPTHTHARLHTDTHRHTHSLT